MSCYAFQSKIRAISKRGHVYSWKNPHILCLVETKSLSLPSSIASAGNPTKYSRYAIICLTFTLHIFKEQIIIDFTKVPTPKLA